MKADVDGIRMAAAPSVVRPCMFGADDAPLYGCYHVPQAPSRGLAVLICQPVGHEFIRSHRCLRNLANNLCASGMPVLRFDYLGCGDSAGDDEDVSVPGWLASIALAWAELQRRAQGHRLIVVGLRLGATLAALATAERLLDAEALVLWQPFITGERFLHETRHEHERHAAWAAKEFGPLPPGAASELLGCRWPKDLIEELRKLDLLQMRCAPAQRVLVLDNNEQPTCGPLTEHLSALGAHVEAAHVPEPGIWDAEPYLAVLPHLSLRTIVGWIEGRFA